MSKVYVSLDEQQTAVVWTRLWEVVSAKKEMTLLSDMATSLCGGCYNPSDNNAEQPPKL